MLGKKCITMFQANSVLAVRQRALDMSPTNEKPWEHKLFVLLHQRVLDLLRDDTVS